MIENKELTLICPAYNNKRHLENLHESILEYGDGVKVIYIDDNSSDGTWEWMNKIHNDFDYCVDIHRSLERVGHTILYDKGIEMATTKYVGVIHADMIISHMTIANLLKHIEPKKVVCSTRIEPPLHGAQKEKIIKDFGQDFNTLETDKFHNYVNRTIPMVNGNTTKGMFAPWIISKEDFQSSGGHDTLFAPFPLEDSDIFQRWILKGYELIQSRDSFVYHLTCRGHRWTEEIGKDDESYKKFAERARKNWIRKWGTPFPINDPYSYPKIHPYFKVVLYSEDRIDDLEALNILELGFHKIFVNADIEKYIERYQSETEYDLSESIFHYEDFNEPDPSSIFVEVENLDELFANSNNRITPYTIIISTLKNNGMPESSKFKGVSVTHSKKLVNINFNQNKRLL